MIIERRADFRAADYPQWPPYSALPDHAYGALEVAIRAPEGHVLAGTLTMPPNKVRVAAAVLITGLSPHERNNGDAPWRPFRAKATRHKPDIEAATSKQLAEARRQASSFSETVCQ